MRFFALIAALVAAPAFAQDASVDYLGDVQEFEFAGDAFDVPEADEAPLPIDLPVHAIVDVDGDQPAPARETTTDDILFEGLVSEGDLTSTQAPDTQQKAETFDFEATDDDFEFEE